MLRLLKRMAGMGVLAAGVPAALAFSTGGPNNEAWQVHDLGYHLVAGDLMAPKNIGEDYRRNTPVLYYAFDETFLDFFGSNGVWAVDQAFAILNNLTNVSSYSADLSEIPLEAVRFNQTAGALGLMDLKSEVLAMVVEQLGLADPIRFTWDLHDRFIPPGAACPLGMEYLVTKRNYAIVPSDLDQLQYSSYVNDVLYSYYIHDYCANPPGNAPLSQAVPIPVDVTENASRFLPVASGNNLAPGQFFTGLTRDDVAGIRYLIRAGHVHWEDNPANSIVFVTNNAPGALQLVVTTNLALLSAQSLTNNDAALLALYPNLAIVPNSTTASLTNVVTTNTFIYYTNNPMAPPGSPPDQKTGYTYTTNVMFVYTRAFANVVTQSFARMSFVTVIDTNIYYPPRAPAGYFVTNTPPPVTMLTNLLTGDFYLLPPTNCGVQVLSNVLTAAFAVTNTLIVTNTPTNVTSGTYLLSRTYITWWTNHNLAYFAVNCVSNEPSLRRGVEKISFVKTAYDSLLGRAYTPQTNFFTMTVVTNSTNWVQTYERVVTNADIIFTASDGAPGPAGQLIIDESSRNINFNTNNELPNLAGPGIIEPITIMNFNKSGPLFYNTVANGTWSLDERTALEEVMWATYDDSTNAPVLYPNGTSIASLESQILMQVTSTTLPPGKAGTAYTTQLTGTGGRPPYSWTLAPNSPALPAGLVLTLDGRLSGTPTAPSNNYSFFVQMTGTDGGFTVWQVTLTVLP